MVQDIFYLPQEQSTKQSIAGNMFDLVDGDESSTRTLFVRNLNRSSSPEEIYVALSNFGSIAEMDLKHLNSEGFVVVTYHDLRQSQFAFRQVRYVLPLLSPHICQPNSTPGIHYFVQVSSDLYSPQKNEGILLVESPSIILKVEDFKPIFSKFGDIKKIFSLDQSMLIVEYYDLRSAEYAFSYFNDPNLIGPRLYISYVNGNTSWEIAGYGGSKMHKGCTSLANAISSCQPFMFAVSPFSSPKSSPPSSPVISPPLTPPMTSPSSNNSSPSSSRSSSPIPSSPTMVHQYQYQYQYQHQHYNSSNSQMTNSNGSLSSSSSSSTPNGSMMNSNMSSPQNQNQNQNSNNGHNHNHNHVSPPSSRSQGNEKFQVNLENIAKGIDKRTTLMIRNIPNKYTQDMLLEFLDQEFKGLYDFIYLPIDFKNKCNVGYSFINFINPLSIIPFTKQVHGKKWTRFNSEKICQLTYARIQGKESLIRHFQNSTIMSEDKTYQPKIFHSSGPFIGQEMRFPDPAPEMNDQKLSKVATREDDFE